MSQNNLVIPNTGTLSGLTLVNDTNAIADTLNTLNSGGSAPNSPSADMLWVDSTNGLIKQRDGGNANWYPQWVRGVPHGGGMRFSGQSTPITGSQTLLITTLGQLVLFNPTSAPISVACPNASTFPPGTGFMVYNTGTQLVTFTMQGGNTIDGGTVTYAPPGEQFMLMSDGTSIWRTFLRSTSSYVNISGANGNVRVSNGIINQWGSAIVTTSSVGGCTFSWLTPFPNTIYTALLTIGDNNVQGATVTGIASQQNLAGTGAQVFAAGVALNAGTVRINFHAIGA